MINNSNDNFIGNLDRAKIVVALRAARGIVGWSQAEFAKEFDIPKTTVARIETMESDINASLLSIILRKYNGMGITLDYIYSDDLTIRVKKDTVLEFEKKLLFSGNRRSDRGKSRKPDDNAT